MVDPNRCRVSVSRALLDAAVAEAGRLALFPGDALRTTKESFVRHTARRMRDLLPEDLALIDRIGG